MNVVRRLCDWPRDEICGAIAIGVFDGVHLGHQAVIRMVSQRAGDLPACVLTFEPHPAAALGREGPPFLTSFSQKCDLIAAMGVHTLFVVPFTPEFASTAHSEFSNMLWRYLRPRWVVVGEDFRYGAGAKGDIRSLEREASELGFKCIGVPSVVVDGMIVSSTAIRRLIVDGDLDRAATLLGRTYGIRGTVLRGDGRGRTLGFPTANIKAPAGQVLPPDGVYAAVVSYSGQRWPAVLNLGTRPTFGPGLASLEVHIIGFDGNVYGETLDVDFVARIRDETRFDDVDALSRQIRFDVGQALDILARKVGLVYNKQAL